MSHISQRNNTREGACLPFLTVASEQRSISVQNMYEYRTDISIGVARANSAQEVEQASPEKPQQEAEEERVVLAGDVPGQDEEP